MDTRAVITLVGLRFGGVGLSFVLAPRWIRRLMADFVKMSDAELRVIGYVLVGSAAALFAQQASLRALSAKIDALPKDRALPA